MTKTAADKLEQQRVEKAFADADARLDAIAKKRELSRWFAKKAEEAKQRTAEIQAKKEAKERKADPLYDERKAARAKAETGATTKMVGGVKVTEYPAVEDVERPVTARPIGKPIPGESQKYRAYTEGGGGRGTGAGSLLHEMNPQKLYKKGGAVKSASARADGIAQRGKTRGMMR